MPDSSPPFVCRVCGGETDTSVSAPEMMYGTRERFDYFECPSCGCVQISEVPDDLAPYYPDSYPFFGEPKTFSATKRVFRRLWARHHLGRPSPVGALLTRVYGKAEFFSWAERAGVGLEDKILDVGCGRGKRLMEMSSCGFTDLTGVDPFIEQTYRYPGGVVVHRDDPKNLDGGFDLVMSHHSFEHVPEPLDFLRTLHRLARPGGAVLVRIPLAGSDAWRRYGVDWMGLDPPRHLHLHTVRSMEILAEQVGLEVEDVVWDGTAMTLWASEQYRNDIPLIDPRSHFVDPERSMFTADDLRGYEAQAEASNANERGDGAAFFLRRP